MSKTRPCAFFLDSVVEELLTIRAFSKYVEKLAQEIDISSFDELDLIFPFQDSITHITGKQIKHIESLIDGIKERMEIEEETEGKTKK